MHLTLFSEQRFSLAENDRINVEEVFVDQVQIHERRSKRRTREEYEILPRLLLQSSNFLADMILDDSRIPPLNIVQSSRKYNLGCRIDPACMVKIMLRRCRALGHGRPVALHQL